MKKAFYILFTVSFSVTNFAQENIDQLLAAGINDAKRFTSDYIAPASEGLAYGINNGWFNHGKSPKRFGFEISIIANAAFVKDEHKSFTMNSSDYENIRFSDNSTSKNVATALGQNDPEITVIITYDDPIFGNQEAELTLPTGIGSANVNLIPTAFVQASFSPFKGTQIKGRFFPKTQIDDAEIGLYGVGLQQEFTSWLPADKIFPIAISGLVAYTHLDGQYDFTEEGFVAGENQKVQTDVNTILAQLIVSTKLKIINFYGGIGYLSGKSTTSLLGRYKVSDGVLFSEEIVDPFSIKQDASGMRGTLGANLQLGFFGLNADYTMAEFDSASLGLNFLF
ncbi:hypothetical protein LX77_03019 [Gelidibacter algens]|uniref:Uncharacterized protein n=1 Tax=Gelidibacter algens TaxID=49280 RepID=A0A1A7QSD5_9FLAO|nr:DUF6588 family protein [Gelidibacter algens]OBX22238.1 hypothetical protein A9996_17180 [Gelidibacter algens]RAJ20760.1 hypothetical protein LX77_03019 [Gelidibacter algens]